MRISRENERIQYCFNTGCLDILVKQRKVSISLSSFLAFVSLLPAVCAGSEKLSVRDKSFDNTTEEWAKRKRAKPEKCKKFFLSLSLYVIFSWFPPHLFFFHSGKMILQIFLLIFLVVSVVSSLLDSILFFYPLSLHLSLVLPPYSSCILYSLLWRKRQNSVTLCVCWRHNYSHPDQ